MQSVESSSRSETIVRWGREREKRTATQDLAEQLVHAEQLALEPHEPALETLREFDLLPLCIAELSELCSALRKLPARILNIMYGQVNDELRAFLLGPCRKRCYVPPSRPAAGQHDSHALLMLTCEHPPQRAKGGRNPDADLREPADTACDGGGGDGGCGARLRRADWEFARLLLGQRAFDAATLWTLEPFASEAAEWSEADAVALGNPYYYVRELQALMLATMGIEVVHSAGARCHGALFHIARRAGVAENTDLPEPRGSGYDLSASGEQQAATAERWYAGIGRIAGAGEEVRARKEGRVEAARCALRRHEQTG